MSPASPAANSSRNNEGRVVTSSCYPVESTRQFVLARTLSVERGRMNMDNLPVRSHAADHKCPARANTIVAQVKRDNRKSIEGLQPEVLWLHWGSGRSPGARALIQPPKLVCNICSAFDQTWRGTEGGRRKEHRRVFRKI